MSAHFNDSDDTEAISPQNGCDIFDVQCISMLQQTQILYALNQNLYQLNKNLSHLVAVLQNGTMYKIAKNRGN